MNNVILKNDIGESVVATILRYFSYNNENYMLYTMNEVDPSNYIKLYGVKILPQQDNSFSAVAIEDSIWGQIVSLIKEMVKPLEQRINNSFVDLNSNNILTINLISKRVFKINKDMAMLLASNINVVNPGENIAVNNEISINTNENMHVDTQQTYTEQLNVENNNPQIDYKELYEKEKEKTLQLSQELEILKNKILDVRNIVKE